jgi:hypothetical protein
MISAVFLLAKSAGGHRAAIRLNRIGIPGGADSEKTVRRGWINPDTVK